MLYPLKFKPQLKEVLWGGSRLVAAGKKPAKGTNPSSVGESWELSGLAGHESVVANGMLRSNDSHSKAQGFSRNMLRWQGRSPHIPTAEIGSQGG